MSDPTPGERRGVMPSRMPAFNKRFVNPVQLLWAPWLPPFAVVHHVGRRSGRDYRTPVLASRTGTVLAIPLLYGRTEWVRNILAAGGGDIRRIGRRLRVTNPRIVDQRAAGQVPPIFRYALTKVDVLLVDISP